MVALKYVLGNELDLDLFECRFCDKKYHTKNGAGAMRRHYEAHHNDILKELLEQFGFDPLKQEMQEKEIKLESDDYQYHDGSDERGEGGASEGGGIQQNMDNSINPETKAPAWFPSSKGRSIVWEHITWVAESQRAACNYCPAEFQIKGGTSALLRHLKTIHPAAINFDPENPPPVVRRKKRKMEDYTVVSEDTNSYMANLLEQFLNDDNVPRAVDPEPSSSPQIQQQQQEDQQQQEQQEQEAQSRADSEIDEVIRNLRKETAQNGGIPEPDQPDQDLKKLLGIADGQCEEVIAIGGGGGGAEPIQQQQHPDEDKQVTSSSGGQQSGHIGSGGSTKKRRTEDPKSMEMSGLNSGKLSLSFLSAIRRPPTTGPPHIATSTSTTVPSLPSGATSSSTFGTPPIPIIPGKYNAHAVSILDFEAKVLYNQSLHSTIAREDAMTTYYRMKSRKMELEIKKLERELGEDEHNEHEHEE